MLLYGILCKHLGKTKLIIGISVIKRLKEIAQAVKSPDRCRKTLVFTSILLFLSSCSNIPDKANNSQLPHKNTSTIEDKVFEQTTLLNLYTGLSKTFNLSQYLNKSDAFPLKEIGTNASGITWDPYRKEYFIIQNNTGILYRYDKDFNYLGKVKKVGNMNNDTEGVSYIDGQSLMVVTEANFAHRVKMDDDTLSDGYFYGESNIQLSGRPLKKNKGFEAIAYRLSDENRDARVYAGQEGSGRYPEAKMRIVYYNANTSNGTYSLANGIVKIEEPFNAEKAFAGVITDIAGMVFDPTGKHLIIVSQESGKVIQVNPKTGEVISQLKLSGAPAYEGVTFGANGELVFISERNLIQIYKR